MDVMWQIYNRGACNSLCNFIFKNSVWSLNSEYDMALMIFFRNFADEHFVVCLMVVKELRGSFVSYPLRCFWLSCLFGLEIHNHFIVLIFCQCNKLEIRASVFAYKQPPLDRARTVFLYEYSKMHALLYRHIACIILRCL